MSNLLPPDSWLECLETKIFWNTRSGELKKKTKKTQFWNLENREVTYHTCRSPHLTGSANIIIINYYYLKPEKKFLKSHWEKNKT